MAFLRPLSDAGLNCADIAGMWMKNSSTLRMQVMLTMTVDPTIGATSLAKSIVDLMRSVVQPSEI